MLKRMIKEVKSYRGERSGINFAFHPIKVNKIKYQSNIEDEEREGGFD